MRKKVKDAKIDEVKVEEVSFNEEEVVFEKKSNLDTPKEEKKRRFFDEFNSFIILAVIIAVVILGGWLFYKYAKPVENNNGEIVESEGYKTVLYSSEKGSLEVVGDKYLIEYNENTDSLKKIMNLYSETLYEAINEEHYEFVMGIDGNLYAIEYIDYESKEGIFNLYVLENNKLVQVREFIDEETHYNFIYQSDITDNLNYSNLIYECDDNEILIGVYSKKEYMDEDLNEITEQKIYTLDGKAFELDNSYFLVSDIERLGEDIDYYTASNRYITVMEYDFENKKSFVGLYDLKKGEIAIEADYEGLYTTSDGNYVAIKNGKAGIINKKLKKLVDFKYDFIDINKDFYVVSKDKKIAIMNNKFEFVTDFIFDFQSFNDGIHEYTYKLASTNLNTFIAYKKNDKYVLTINNKELGYGGLDYKKSETYVIDKNGKYKTIKANEFGLFNSYAYGYLKDSKKLAIYDTVKFEEVSVIDLSDYDFERYNWISISDNGVVDVALDSEIHFDSKTGKELEDNSALLNSSIKVIGEAKIEYDTITQTARIILNDKEITTLSLDGGISSFNKLNDNSFYYCTSSDYVLIEKR